MVSVMARNGVNFGIRLSGTGDRWFQAKANPVEGLFFPGYGVDDAAADLGDSAITETFAFLLQHVAEDPVWLERRLGGHGRLRRGADRA